MKVSSVRVEADHIEITGNAEPAGKTAQERHGLFLVEAPLYTDITAKGAFPDTLFAHSPTASGFKMRVERRRKEGTGYYDRLLLSRHVTE